MKRLVSALLVVMIAPYSSALLADEEGKVAMKYQQEQQRELRKNREAIKDWEEAEREARKDWEEAEGKARKGRQEAVNAMAHGGYHPKNGADGEEKAVKVILAAFTTKPTFAGRLKQSNASVERAATKDIRIRNAGR